MSLSYICIVNMYTYLFIFFFFNDTATTEIYTLSLHDALPISHRGVSGAAYRRRIVAGGCAGWQTRRRSEEHTSELQSQSNLVCRLLLEKKKKIKNKLLYHLLHDQTALGSLERVPRLTM